MRCQAAWAAILQDPGSCGFYLQKWNSLSRIMPVSSPVNLLQWPYIQIIEQSESSMIELRRSEERGHANHGWLDSFHSFSFADYYDPKHMGFGPLRVINEDWINPGMGFGTHGQRDMEIITYVLEGELAHRDSMGNGSVIRPGNVQRMSAGSGVRHSEFNHSQEDTVHLLQIWIEPNVRGIEPGYEEKHFDVAEKRGGLRLIASPEGTVRTQKCMPACSTATRKPACRCRKEGASICTWHVVRFWQTAGRCVPATP
jgi:hypothetical protein